MYIKAAARTATANPPIAIPAIGPAPREVCEDVTGGVVLVDAGGAVGVEVAPVAVVVLEKADSVGKYSNGLNANVAFCV